jgi:hypothetical protein
MIASKTILSHKAVLYDDNVYPNLNSNEYIKSTKNWLYTLILTTLIKNLKKFKKNNSNKEKATTFFKRLNTCKWFVFEMFNFIANNNTKISKQINKTE